jgi:hypothetical protein
MGLVKISHSSIRSFQTCPRKYTYLYHDKRVPTAFSPALQVGTFVHEALDRWWEHGPDACVEWMVENSEELSAVEACRVAALLGEYNPPREDFEWVSNEEPFEVSVPKPGGGVLRGIRVIGFADGILIRKKDGVKVVRECKTTAQQILGFGPFWEKLAIDSQIGMYANAFNVGDIYYDVLRKSQLKVSAADRKAAAVKLKAKGIDERTATSDEIHDAFQARVTAVIQAEPELFFQWRHITVTPEERELAAFNLYQSARALLAAEKNDCWPMHTGSCSMYGNCQYLGVCTGRDDLMDPVRFRDKLTREQVAAQRAGEA